MELTVSLLSFLFLSCDLFPGQRWTVGWQSISSSVKGTNESSWGLD